MKTEAKPELPALPPERNSAPTEAARPGREEYPFYIVPPPPVPGQTGWSIVPW